MVKFWMARCRLIEADNQLQVGSLGSDFCRQGLRYHLRRQVLRDVLLSTAPVDVFRMRAYVSLLNTILPDLALRGRRYI